MGAFVQYAHRWNVEMVEVPVSTVCQTLDSVMMRVCPFQSFSGESKNIKHHLDGNICLREVTIVA